MKKKKLLFVIDSLACAGAEKSLVTLLNLIDFDSYDVDLQLFLYGGELETLVPKEVKILPPLKYTNFASKPFWKTVFIYPPRYVSARISYSSKLRRGKPNNITKARLFWESTGSVIPSNKERYDVAIAYAQGVPTFYVSEKVSAAKKYAWVNVSYYLEGIERTFQMKHYNNMDKIITVSEKTKEIFSQNQLPSEYKMEVIYDINNPELINKMAESGNGYDDNFNGIRILTIGRIARQKGYDIALEACAKLKKNGISFRWYVLGKGPLEKEIREQIQALGLEKEMILLGVKSNPYPYIKEADLYVQTSRFEGYGIALAEARMLNTPIVTTRFDAVYSQMVDGQNGIVVDMQPEAVAEGIQRLLNQHELKEQIIACQKQEKKGNIEEIQKFYDLVGV
ncbi:glycosyl transferase [Virgibacillus profundi]|uniref:Glycosyl transferase n=1 Tax=Virgibacillus profundi TaxID=2024555 RepID=A0A2A2IJ40_9BACI|nr:glycosyltransferase [Virgibacillus profundi]PAV31542.1 glycosyl transferase [Virgibacillus profundi]PXY55728.1 glycosyltransferase [Virgibacillus profundi]